MAGKMPLWHGSRRGWCLGNWVARLGGFYNCIVDEGIIVAGSEKESTLVRVNNRKEMPVHRIMNINEYQWSHAMD